LEANKQCCNPFQANKKESKQTTLFYAEEKKKKKKKQQQQSAPGLMRSLLAPPVTQYA